MQREVLIRLDNVWKIYSLGDVTVEALRGLDLQVRKGEFLAIMGPSGSGKSTAVNMIGALDVPSKGNIYLNEKNISAMTESELAQLRGKTIGFVFQQFNLIPTLNALDNVAMPMMFQGVPREKRTNRAMELLASVGLKDRMFHRPAELSGGQQQRVAIARALSNDPEVILADEPTGNLDTETGGQIMHLLAGLHKKERKTIIMVTHDTHVAEHAQRIEVLMDGRIIKDGKVYKKTIPVHTKKRHDEH